jgi:hypothetical protein
LTPFLAANRAGRVSFVTLWSRAFALTVATELLIATWFLPRTASHTRRLGAVVFANVASHPAVWFVFPELFRSWQVALILSELWAVGSEILIYKLVFPELAWRRALAASALANGGSLLVGLALRAAGVEL